MADVKISNLPASTTPLTGTEVLPVVQSGVTKQVSIANVTAGRAISATQITSTIATGTPPLVIASTTNVPNLNASSLNGATFASPSAIGLTTPAAGTFTTLSATNTVTLSPANAAVTLSPTGTGAVSINPATAGTINNMSIGATTRSTGAFTTLEATNFKVVSTAKLVPVGSTVAVFSILTNNGSGGLIRIIANGTHTGVGQVISSYTFLLGYNAAGNIVGATQTNAGSATLTFSASYSTTACTVFAQLTGGTASTIGFVIEGLGSFTTLAPA